MYQTCTKIIKALIEKGYTKEAPVKEIITMIEIYGGGHKTTQRAYLDFMKKHEFIKLLREGIFELKNKAINNAKVD